MPMSPTSLTLGLIAGTIMHDVQTRLWSMFKKLLSDKWTFYRELVSRWRL